MGGLAGRRFGGGSGIFTKGFCCFRFFLFFWAVLVVIPDDPGGRTLRFEISSILETTANE